MPDIISIFIIGVKFSIGLGSGNIDWLKTLYDDTNIYNRSGDMA